MLAVESSADEVFDGGEVGLAFSAAKDALAAKVLLVSHAHVDGSDCGVTLNRIRWEEHEWAITGLVDPF